MRPFPETDGGVWLISEAPAIAAEWSADGSELLFIDVNSMTLSRVPVLPGTTFGHGSRESLFDMSPFRINSNYTGSGSYAVMPGADRFLALRALQTDRLEELIFVQNIFRVLNQQAPR